VSRWTDLKTGKRFLDRVSNKDGDESVRLLGKVPTAKV
jgi:hypothetical protein